jgi:hypothetical protein
MSIFETGIFYLDIHIRMPLDGFLEQFYHIFAHHTLTYKTLAREQNYRKFKCKISRKKKSEIWEMSTIGIHYQATVF